MVSATSVAAGERCWDARWPATVLRLVHATRFVVMASRVIRGYKEVGYEDTMILETGNRNCCIDVLKKMLARWLVFNFMLL
jgi:hypothetical protein